ncbi:PepSY-associated TM helix domain-containing protein [Neobacillus sp. PS3-40]|uniref:PepSY-associated TM helix domain-containing protein n=1 Tax=Neobacillus sp. PS3-40 TaxID=3070679 RepID=UPI0027E1AD31|nr:PepSY-associated TM helix domain-containing protein [Neobacillus sp. PS3-40]WML44124.1 PepSY-associated TM helix domain-containing protein [Neobacillus sp. PS3-40]
MRKVKRAHLWIGLIASVLIFIEAFSGLLMNEPWLIGQTERGLLEGGQGFGARGNFQTGQFNQGQNFQGSTSQDAGKGTFGNGQTQGQNRFRGNGQFQGRFGGQDGAKLGNQSSFMGILRSLHEGKFGNVNIKWLMDLAALAMMFLTGSGVYLSIKILRAEKKSKN